MRETRMMTVHEVNLLCEGYRWYIQYMLYAGDTIDVGCERDKISWINLIMCV